MGKVIILASLGAGYYRIKLHFDNTRVDARKTYIDTKVAEYATQLTEIESEKTLKTASLNAALAALNWYISNTAPDVYTENPAELNRLTSEGYKARGELDVILHEERIIKLKKTELEQEKKYLIKFSPADFETNAWCVEPVTTLSGIMNAIVVDYALMRDPVDNMIEHDTGVWLPAMPTIPSASLIHPLSSSAHATWFNLAMAPAAQRHKARYRIATIYNLNRSADTCDLSFDGQYSVDRPSGRLIDNFPIYPQIGDVQYKDYAGANIVYGTCNADVFQDLDRVIVDLHDGVGVPTVIGFYEEPRVCEPGSGEYFYLFRTNCGRVTDNPYTLDITGLSVNYSVVSTSAITGSLSDDPDVEHITQQRTATIEVFSGAVLKHTLTVTNSSEFYYDPFGNGYFTKTSDMPILDTASVMIYTEQPVLGVNRIQVQYKMIRIVELGTIENNFYTGTRSQGNYRLVVTDGTQKIFSSSGGDVDTIEDVMTTTDESGEFIRVNSSIFRAGVSPAHEISANQIPVPKVQV